jgi:hypothetical protein
MEMDIHHKECCKNKKIRKKNLGLGINFVVFFFKVEAKNHSENVPKLGQHSSTQNLYSYITHYYAVA